MVGDDMVVAFLEPHAVHLMDDSDQTEIATMYVLTLPSVLLVCSY